MAVFEEGSRWQRRQSSTTEVEGKSNSLHQWLRSTTAAVFEDAKESDGNSL